ncbi:MAG: cysteine--tRNA ligase, partial [archaeon]|nr:cysteine--tRNA ligase [archaeon]
LRIKIDPRREAIAEQVEHLLKKRAEARASKDFATADAIRDELASLNVIVTDTADGPVWELR